MTEFFQFTNTSSWEGFACLENEVELTGAQGCNFMASLMVQAHHLNIPIIELFGFICDALSYGIIDHETILHWRSNILQQLESEREYGLKAGKLPTFSGFARANKISHDAMLEWAEGRKTKDGKPKKPKYPEFAVAYNSCKDLQREFLVDNGLAGLSPPAAYIFTAKNITNMRDKVETDITSGGQPLFVKQSYIKQAEDMKNAKSTTPAK